MARHPRLITGSTWIDKDFRPLTDYERKLLLRLCNQEFEGRTEVLKQIEGLEAKQVDEHGAMGCLEFRVNSEVLTPKKMGLVAEAGFQDSDSQDVFLMLFVHDHKLFDLQIWKPAKDEYEPILRLPNVEDIIIIPSDTYRTGKTLASLRAEARAQRWRSTHKGWFRRWFSLP